ncbi:Lipoprotein, putative [Shewanella piezotolerans WP3]|uniref:Lipoprotein, putative n=1 Tax=Shewanella piezotolerans (strain WP3 / JCM 13877) TaxID=225849 RepID=B8CSP4_SHEPW|nr:hypothetical protein [Shewanella piezotolerans]ACJ30670.1 Lipoprotein, putative [Shewanella piezotolerans WP3]
MVAKAIIAGVVCVSFLALVACNSDSSKTPANQSGTDLSAETVALGIEAIPAQLSSTYSMALKFNRYTKVTAPNNKPIHIVAQDKLSDNQIVRARAILTHYLTDLPGSKYGSDKSAVANKMATNGAILLLLNGSDDGSNSAANLNGQPLYQNEIQVEGGTWYINQDFEQHRDASFEEILHMVHDYGIGIDQNSEFIGALPEFQAEIRSAQITALNDKLWGGDTNWITELTAENSLTQEYLASVIDAYYGLWGAWTGSETHSMWGGYVAKTRAEIKGEDPLAATLMDKQFFHSYLTYNARIDASFKGDFSLRFEPKLGYTHHSQYLKDITLTGNEASNVVVNQFDNNISGNSAKNQVKFSGNSSQYSIEKQEDGTTVVADLVSNRDGVNTLKEIEQLVFEDSSISL